MLGTFNKQNRCWSEGNCHWSRRGVISEVNNAVGILLGSVQKAWKTIWLSACAKSMASICSLLCLCINFSPKTKRLLSPPQTPDLGLGDFFLFLSLNDIKGKVIQWPHQEWSKSAQCTCQVSTNELHKMAQSLSLQYSPKETTHYEVRVVLEKQSIWKPSHWGKYFFLDDNTWALLHR